MKEINIWDKLEKGWKVDKIKFKYILKKIEDIQMIIDNLAIDNKVTQIWESKDFKKCRYNYNLEQDKGTIYIGIESNQYKGDEEERRKTLVLEYNPQKTNPFNISYLKILKELDLHRRKVLFMDLAYDMEIDINDIEYTKRRTNERWAHLGKQELETIYLGTKGTNGVVKIYDKVKEMNKTKEEELEKETGEVNKLLYKGKCTRYEISIKPEEQALYFNLPNAFLFESLVKLHNLNIKIDNESIQKEILKLDGADFKNIISIHIGAIDKVNKNSRKKYLNLYQEIKKSCANTNKHNPSIFNNFNIQSAYKCATTYLYNTTIHKDNQIIIDTIN